MGVKTNKQEYFEKLRTLLEEHKSIFVVSVDNVRSLISSSPQFTDEHVAVGLVAANARDP